MKDVVIIDAVRSPVGRVGGALSSVRPDDMLATLMRQLIDRVGLDPALVDDIYAGCANQAGEDNRNVARMSGLLAGFPESVPGVTVNRLCASGLEAVNQAAKAIAIGEGDVFIGGGVESMSRAPWVVARSDEPDLLSVAKMHDSRLGWRLINPKMDAMGVTMALGETAEILAERMHITREDQDAFAFESHRRAVDAMASGRFDDEIVPIHVTDDKGEIHTIEIDEHPRYSMENGTFQLRTSLEKLASLQPVFRIDGTVTAGNASGLNDGAAAVLVMSGEKAKELGLQPIARWLGSATAGVDPKTMGLGPVPATKKLLKRARFTISDIDLIELNEAFAAQALAVIRELELDVSKTNVNGGAVALGHPLGCSGARILTTLVHEMKRRATSSPAPIYGLATLCVGVGQGIATLVETV